MLWSAEGTHLTGYSCTSSPPLAERVNRTYDALNRLKSVSYASGTNGITYGYKPDGALAWANTSDGINWTYEYNKLRLLTSEQSSLEGMTFRHGYTSLGHLSSTTYPHGVTVSHAPNALGQPTRVGSFATGATYHPNGALKSFVYGNQLTRTYTQNTRMLVSGIVDRYSTSAALHDFQHVYDQAGNLTSITDVPGIADRTMAYDYLDRLVTANASSLWGLGRYAYDPLDNLREADIGARYYNYNYATNWRLSNIRTDAGTTVWNFGYDVRGNQTSKGSQSYTFDRANRITAIPGLVSTYFYDGHGRRQAEIRATGHARYTLRTKDGLMRGGPDSAKSAGVWHYYLGSQLVATTTNPHSGATPTTAYQHTDHLGSVIRETGPTRNTISQTYYEPYGQPTNRTVDGPGYTSHVMDAPSGLIYMEQRYYDPLVGRFASIDPVAADANGSSGFNRYWYGNNNPFSFVDPDGREVVFAFRNGARVSDGMETLAYLMRSPTARAEMLQLQRSTQTYTLSFDMGSGAYMTYDHLTRTVTSVPNSGLRVGDAGEIQSAAVGTAHELSHAAEHDRIGTAAFENKLEAPLLDFSSKDGKVKVTYGTSPEENRATTVESQIARELGEPTRSGYAKDKGEVRTCGPTSRREC